MKISSKIAVMSLASALALAACDKGTEPTQPKAAQAAAGDATLMTGLGDARTFDELARSAGLDGTLAGPGPYTVLAPSDEAFAKLPPGTLDTLKKPESRAALTGILTYHILPGTILASDIAAAIDKGKGSTTLPTMAGGTIKATKEGDSIVLTDGAGHKAKVVAADEKRSNGVIHRLDGVLQPS